jgi:hypothetical protein
VRTSASQNHVTATLSTEEFFLRTVYIALPLYQQRGVGRGNRILTFNATHWQSQLSFSSQPNLYTAEQGLQNLYNYFVTGEDARKPIFSFMAIQ